MTQEKLSLRLRILIVGVGIAILALVTVLLPSGEGLTRLFSTLFWVLAAVPCCIALVCSWRIAGNIRRDRSFSEENARLLRRISTLAAVDSAYLFAVETIRFFFHADPLPMLVFCIAVSAFGVVLSVAFAALSHLVRKAALLQEEHDLTI